MSNYFIITKSFIKQFKLLNHFIIKILFFFNGKENQDH